MSSILRTSPQPLHVVVLAGGDSAERDISLESGQAVQHALQQRQHRVQLVDPQLQMLEEFDWTGVDAAFIALHGRYGEDGQVQAALATLGISFTGSDALTSQVAFSKSACKERLLQQNIPTPAYVLIHETDDAGSIENKARKLAYPLVVKPDSQGSSLGVSIVSSATELPTALSRCFHFDAYGILEAAVPGTEWTLGMLDDVQLPLLQIETEQEFYDYEAKYRSDQTRYAFDFEIGTSDIQAIETAGRGACHALGTRGLARVDIRVDRYNRPWVLEVNTVPGLTDHSLVPKAAARMGVSFDRLCEAAVMCCLQPVPNQK